MSRALFLRIAGDVANHDPYFQQRPDATGRPGLSTIQKCTAALRMLAYGASADSIDENLRMAESTALETLKRFCLAVNDVYAAEALSPPNVEQTQMLLEENAKRGFPGMLGSLDCCHWIWSKCPTGWHGTYLD